MGTNNTINATLVDKILRRGTGKAFFGMVEELKRDPKCFGERIIFIHTGGIFGLLPKAGELEPYL